MNFNKGVGVITEDDVYTYLTCVYHYLRNKKCFFSMQLSLQTTTKIVKILLVCRFNSCFISEVNVQKIKLLIDILFAQSLFIIYIVKR